MNCAAFTVSLLYDDNMKDARSTAAAATAAAAAGCFAKSVINVSHYFFVAV